MIRILPAPETAPKSGEKKPGVKNAKPAGPSDFARTLARRVTVKAQHLLVSRPVTALGRDAKGSAKLPAAKTRPASALSPDDAKKSVLSTPKASPRVLRVKKRRAKPDAFAAAAAVVPAPVILKAGKSAPATPAVASKERGTGVRPPASANQPHRLAAGRPALLGGPPGDGSAPPAPVGNELKTFPPRLDMAGPPPPRPKGLTSGRGQLVYRVQARHAPVSSGKGRPQEGKVPQKLAPAAKSHPGAEIVVSGGNDVPGAVLKMPVWHQGKLAAVRGAAQQGALEPHAAKGWVIRPVHWKGAPVQASKWLVTVPKSAAPLVVTLTALQNAWKVDFEVATPAWAGTLAQTFASGQNLMANAVPVQQVSVFLGMGGGMGGSAGGSQQNSPQDFASPRVRLSASARIGPVYSQMSEGVDYQA